MPGRWVRVCWGPCSDLECPPQWDSPCRQAPVGEEVEEEAVGGVPPGGR